MPKAEIKDIGNAIVDILQERGVIPTPVKSETVKPPKTAWSKEDAQQYTGPVNMTVDNKIPTSFMLNERCGFETEIKDERGNPVKKKCEEQLFAKRVHRVYFERDSRGFGGQLQYDDRDARFYKQCNLHGPFDLPTQW